jgi:hypothetical protein
VQAPAPAASVPVPAPAPTTPVAEPATPQPAGVPAPSRPEPAATDEATWPLLCGQVVDSAGNPVVGARVLVADLDVDARTDKRGRFCFSAPPGERTVSVVAMGFAPWREVVSLVGQTLELRIPLKNAP